ncbi:MAG TPA: EAL domain-containing protein [Rubrivivax sp.]|nr:EAL domain-containing protein [Rubrivivax sp.]HRY88106.1 EAL domain-containing protein [Rubrivivax sp.]
MSSSDPLRDDRGIRATEVLLVDDDEVYLLLTAIALRERGFAVTEAAGGEQALRQLAERTPDLVVLDAMMPALDGFDTCRRLRALPGGENVPVLMLTGLDDDASIQRAYQAGATDFFVKSNQWSLLAGRLQYLMRASRTRLELERSKATLARAQDLARMGSFDWRRQGGSTGRLILSTQGQRVLGFAPGRRAGLRQMLHLIAADRRKGVLRMLREADQHASVLATDLPVRLPDGRERIIHVEAEPEFDEQGRGTGYTGIVQDVTDRRLAEDRIRHLANFDSLTGLPNRRHLVWRMERAIEHARRLGHQCAFLLIDLDRFKLVNDTLGHAAGDELLMEVAARLRDCVRHCDQVFEGALEAAGSRAHRSLEAVGRLGGDEFIALLPEVGDEADAQRVAQRVLEKMRAPILVGTQECFVTASVGIALYPRDGQSVADLLRNSDVAMYAAKAQGKDAAALYSPMLAGSGRDRLELESALHKAIERGELVLHYQPIIDVRSARMIGAEALMRWQRGPVLVPPGEFIPLAEETGLIVPMSMWALREAARQARAWKASFGFDESIAVNLPSRLFERSDLVDHIDEFASAAGVPHRSLKLEITESGLMKDLQALTPGLYKLKDLNVEVAIDDFGTGYSSLAYLTTLPIAELKIDRSFVQSLGVSPQSAAVVTAIIALARSLGLRVIGEGVENLRQMEVLHRLGCGAMQGYLFSRAIPADEIERWLQQTVLPRKAPWIARAAGQEPGGDGLRAAGGRPA